MEKDKDFFWDIIFSQGKAIPESEDNIAHMQ